MRPLHVAGVISLVLIVILLAPKNSDILIGRTLQPLAVEETTGGAARIAPETAAFELYDEISCKSAYFCYADTHSVIAEKNSGERLAPASLTKIMTSIVVLENVDSLDVDVTVPSEVYDKLYLEGASMAGFFPGETVKLRDLMYGILLPSGAEAAAAAAEYVAGSEEAFVSMMNTKALEMGLANTHFENIYGFDDDDHYSNAAEMAYILSYALENDEFCKISSSKSYTVSPTNKHPDGFTMKSTVFTKIGDSSPNDAVILGGKTGYTDDAGLCLAVYGEADGITYVSIVLGVEGNHRTEQKQVNDTIYLFNKFS